MENQNKTIGQGNINTSVVRAFDILELLNTCGYPLTVADICRELSLNRITCNNLVKTLISKKYVYKNDSGKICLTGKVYVMGQIFKEGFPIIEMFNTLAAEITKQYNCASHLVTFAGLNQGILLAQVPSVSIYANSLHLYVPLYCTGAGKVLLANQPKKNADTMVSSLELTPLTDKTITSKEVLKKELIKIKESGYGIDNCEYKPGLYCVSAPVFNMDGSVNTAVSLTNLIINDELKIEHYIQPVHQFAQTLSQVSGYKKLRLNLL